MQPLSLERQLARIIRNEEEAAERASTIRRPTERAVILSLVEHKALPWEVIIPPERLMFSRQYFTARANLRTCENCKLKLPRSDFERARYSHDGLAFWCARCQRDKKRLRWADRVAYANGKASRKAA